MNNKFVAKLSDKVEVSTSHLLNETHTSRKISNLFMLLFIYLTFWIKRTIFNV